MGAPLRVSPWPQASSPHGHRVPLFRAAYRDAARLRGLGAHPFQQRGARVRDRDAREAYATICALPIGRVAPSQRNRCGTPLCGGKKRQKAINFILHFSSTRKRPALTSARSCICRERQKQQSIVGFSVNRQLSTVNFFQGYIPHQIIFIIIFYFLFLLFPGNLETGNICILTW